MSTVALDETTLGERAPQVVARLRAQFDGGRTRPLAFRLRQLEGLERFVRECEGEFERALREDMGRPAFEVYPSEIAFVVAEAALARKKLFNSRTSVAVQARRFFDFLAINPPFQERLFVSLSGSGRNNR